MPSETPHPPRFFVLNAEDNGSRYDVEADKVEPINRGEAARCARCGGFVGMLTWLPPYRVDLILHGEAPGDCIRLVGDDLLLSERFANAFRQEELTGLSGFHPVEVRRVRRKVKESRPAPVPRYVVATVCAGRAAVDLTRSHVLYVKPPTCEECRYEGYDVVKGFTLEPGTWRGEDIFVPRGLQGLIVVSERFARLATHQGLNPARLAPTEEFIWNPLHREG